MPVQTPTLSLSGYAVALGAASRQTFGGIGHSLPA
jgi:hypothetical protein